jgi:hypothetical protein
VDLPEEIWREYRWFRMGLITDAERQRAVDLARALGGRRLPASPPAIKDEGGWISGPMLPPGSTSPEQGE